LAHRNQKILVTIQSLETGLGDGDLLVGQAGSSQRRRAGGCMKLPLQFEIRMAFDLASAMFIFCSGANIREHVWRL
jgi:hypothetical protein